MICHEALWLPLIGAPLHMMQPFSTAALPDQFTAQMLSEQAPVGLVLLAKPGGEIVHLNRKARQILGCAPGMAVPTHIHRYIGGESVWRHWCLLLSQKPQGHEEELMLRDTEHHAFWAWIGLQRLQHQNQQWVLLSLINIQNRKHQEAQWLASNERLHRVLQTTSEGYVQFAVNTGLIEEVNPALCQMLGLQRADMLGRPLKHWVAPEQQALEAEQAQLMRTTRHREYEITMLGAQQQKISVLVSASTLFDDEGRAQSAFALLRDITERKVNEERILYLALYDTLTALPNRILLQERLEHALKHRQRNGGMVAVLFVDLDHFKPVNDKYGHEQGDKLLQAVAQRLFQSVRQCDTVARFGGDEFIIVLERLESLGDVEIIAEKLVDSLSSPFELDELRAQIGCSIGVALAPQHGSEAAQLKHRADEAMYWAKAQGRNRYAIWCSALSGNPS